MKKIKVAILFGGISAEHDISILSAKSIIVNIDKNKFEIIPIKISKHGKFDIKSIIQADVVFPCLHGKGGEDGSIQGFLETIGKKYIGSGIKASAIALDKVLSKIVFQKNHLLTPPFQYFTKFQWQENPTQIMQRIDPPVFIKPANTGSSIGISKIKKKTELKKAIKQALEYDDKIIVEKVIKNIREIEVAIIGNNTYTVSLPGEIIPSDDFYSYQAKYKSNSKLIIPAKLSKKKNTEIQKKGENAYRTIGCRGMARIDFFLEKPEGKIYINEVNTIPGFTQISMFPKLFEASGLKYQYLITKLINLALKND